mgnify:CR=1 FL=1
MPPYFYPTTVCLGQTLPTLITILHNTPLNTTIGFTNEEEDMCGLVPSLPKHENDLQVTPSTVYTPSSLLSLLRRITFPNYSLYTIYTSSFPTSVTLTLQTTISLVTVTTFRPVGMCWLLGVGCIPRRMRGVVTWLGLVLACWLVKTLLPLVQWEKPS